MVALNTPGAANERQAGGGWDPARDPAQCGRLARPRHMPPHSGVVRGAHTGCPWQSGVSLDAEEVRWRLGHTRHAF
eukprot:7922182-Pyramimonas_sp.AAC.1